MLSQAPVTWKALLVSIFASFGGILFGYDSGYINGFLGMKQFKKDFGHGGWVKTLEAYDGFLYKSWQKSVVISILSAGTLVGSLAAGYFEDKIGRRKTITMGCIVYIIGAAPQATVQAMNPPIVGHVIAGVGARVCLRHSYYLTCNGATILTPICAV